MPARKEHELDARRRKIRANEVEKSGQLLIFAADPADLPCEPLRSVLNRDAAKRAADRARQNRCRAKKARQKLTALAKANPRAPKSAEWHRKDEMTLAVQICIMGAIQLHKGIAKEIFDAIEPSDFTQEGYALVYAAAKSVFERGFPVTRGAVEAELKANKVILLKGAEILDLAFDLKKVPRFADGQIEGLIEKMKAA